MKICFERKPKPAERREPADTLYGFEGDEHLDGDIDSFIDRVEGYDYLVGTGPREFVQWDVWPPEHHLPTAERLLEWCDEQANENGEVTEDWEMGVSGEDLAAAQWFLSDLASRVYYRMARDIVETHTIEVLENESVLIDGKPWRR